MDSSEPPSSSNGEPPSPNRAKSLFLVGKNSRGNWVVQDQTGLCGGMFVNRAEALKFAMFENGNRPQAVIMVSGVLELDMSRKPRAAGASTSATQIPVCRLSGSRSVDESVCGRVCEGDRGLPWSLSCRNIANCSIVPRARAGAGRHRASTAAW